MAFDCIPAGWTREHWDGCLLIGHPEGGFASVDFESGLWAPGMGKPTQGQPVDRSEADWQERLVGQAVQHLMDDALTG